MRKILITIITFMCLITLTACANKVALSNEELTSKLNDLGFDVKDITDNMEDSNVNVVKTANNGKYQMEYYVFKSQEKAKEAYKNNKKTLSSNKKYEGKSTGKDNYEKYVQETDGSYNSVIRIDNTMIYVSVNIDYKKDVKKVLNKLGY